MITQYIRLFIQIMAAFELKIAAVVNSWMALIAARVILIEHGRNNFINPELSITPHQPTREIRHASTHARALACACTRISCVDLHVCLIRLVQFGSRYTARFQL